MGRKALSWVMAARKYGLVTADEMFPDEDEPRPTRQASKLVRTQAPENRGSRAAR